MRALIGILLLAVAPGLAETGRSLPMFFFPNIGQVNSSIRFIAETPEFTGHVIAALAADPDVLAVSGRTLIGAEVARQYGISDRDGRHPPSVRELMSVAPATYHGRIRR